MFSRRFASKLLSGASTRRRRLFAAVATSATVSSVVFAAAVLAKEEPSKGSQKRSNAAAATPSADDDGLKVISLDEVLKHTTEKGGIWVTYNGFVYDVTPFLDNHPGGRELILTAGGLDLEHFFSNYKVHMASDKAQNYLDGMKIGKLTPADAQRAKELTTPAKHVESRMAVLGAARRRMMLVVATMPFWLLLRFLLRLIGLLLPAIPKAVAKLLPVSVPLYGSGSHVPPKKSDGSKTRIAVIGGGIAGSGCAYALSKAGYAVTLYEARQQLSGNARTFDWDVKGKQVKTCVSVTAWPANLYKNYVLLLKELGVQTKPQHLSWFLNSRVPGHEGFLWAADPSAPEGSLRKHFAKDFAAYGTVLGIVEKVTKVLTFQLWQEPSMYSLQSGLGVLNPFATFPLHHMYRLFGGSQAWWDVVFTPHYTASFLSDKLDNLVCVAGPVIEQNIPLLPKADNTSNSVITTCETWADAGIGIREVFAKLTTNCDVKVDTRVLKVSEKPNGQMTVIDEHGGMGDFERVVFACPSNAVGNMLEGHNWVEDAILATPEYADDHHPGVGHMHAVMHNDASVIAPEFREEVLKRGSNYVEITRMKDGTLNIENTYNFGVQTPSMVGLPLNAKVPMLITHCLGEGKSIDPKLIRGDGNHVRAHPLYSGWNVAALLSLRLIQGRRGVYYCSNYTTPGNCHDMSLLSGLMCAQAMGAPYLFEDNYQAKRDFNMLRSLMGL